MIPVIDWLQTYFFWQMTNKNSSAHIFSIIALIKTQTVATGCATSVFCLALFLDYLISSSCNELSNRIDDIGVMPDV